MRKPAFGMVCPGKTQTDQLVGKLGTINCEPLSKGL